MTWLSLAGHGARRRLAEHPRTGPRPGERARPSDGRFDYLQGQSPGVLAGAGLGTLAVGVVVSPVLAVALVVCLVWWWRRRQASLRTARQLQLPESLERMAGALRTGSSVAQALAEAARTVEAPLGPELGAMAQATSRGRPLAEVVDEWAAAHADRGTRLVATAVVLATSIGVAPARALDGVAATLRERLELAGERRSLATQARVSALVLSVAPVGFAVLLSVSDPAIAEFLTASSAGWLCLTVGLGLDVAGALWMTRLTKAVVR